MTQSMFFDAYLFCFAHTSSWWSDARVSTQALKGRISPLGGAKVNRNPNLRKSGGNRLPFSLACLWGLPHYYQLPARCKTPGPSIFFLCSLIGKLMHRPLFEHAARDIRQDGHPQSYRVRDIDEERFEDYPLEFILLGMESSDMDALVRQFSSVYYYTITYYYETSLFI